MGKVFTLELLGILLGNGLLGYGYLSGEMGFGEIMWAYWAQSIVIGICNFVRMASLTRFSTEGLKSNGEPVKANAAGKWSTAAFFVFHFGFFHVVYSVFLGGFFGVPDLGASEWLAWAVGVFALGELAATVQSIVTDRCWEPNLGTLMFMPYLRIVPMHLTIILGGVVITNAFDGRTYATDGGSPWLLGVVLFFLLLKFLADVGMYAVDQHLERKRMTASAS